MAFPAIAIRKPRRTIKPGFGGTSLRRRIVGIVVVAAVGMALIYAVALGVLRNEMMAGRQAMLANLSETALSAIAAEHAEFTAGRLDEAEAKRRAMSVIKRQRWGGGVEYWWINDLDGMMVMHPMKAALDNTNVLGMKDPKGKALFAEFNATVRAHDAGFVGYLWPKPGHGDVPVPKLSHVRLFKPWGWVVGTGVYMDDVNAAFLRVSGLLGLGALVIAGGIIWLGLIRAGHIARPLESMTSSVTRLAGGDLRVDIGGQD
ncbi:MAG: cache domain-containing protein, partial [Rhodospirillales bacterium]|nr:cache domain-containing protein [Rhodospirillales bacterium]